MGPGAPVILVVFITWPWCRLFLTWPYIFFRTTCGCLGSLREAFCLCLWRLTLLRPLFIKFRCNHGDGVLFVYLIGVFDGDGASFGGRYCDFNAGAFLHFCA